VKQNDLDESKENAREKQKIQVYKANHKLPLKPSHRDGKHQAPLAKKQNDKNQGVW
jgi:hypothetical protein